MKERSNLVHTKEEMGREEMREGEGEGDNWLSPEVESVGGELVCFEVEDVRVRETEKTVQVILSTRIAT